jgi:DNA polymerase-1
MKAFNDKTNNGAAADGFVKNPFGRKRHLEADKSYRAVNALVQGSCADAAKIAMIRIHKLFQGTKSHLLIMIHDEIVCEIHKSELDLIPQIKKCMIDFPQFTIPLDVDIKWTKTNWADKEKWAGTVK